MGVRSIAKDVCSLEKHRGRQGQSAGDRHLLTVDHRGQRRARLSYEKAAQYVTKASSEMTVVIRSSRNEVGKREAAHFEA